MAVKVDGKFLRKQSTVVTGWQGKVKGVRDLLATKVQTPFSTVTTMPPAYNVVGAVGTAKVTWDAAARVGMQELALIAAILNNTVDTFDLTEQELSDAIAASQDNPIK